MINVSGIYLLFRRMSTMHMAINPANIVVMIFIWIHLSKFANCFNKTRSSRNRLSLLIDHTKKNKLTCNHM
jgi:hypothetical protein